VRLEWLEQGGGATCAELLATVPHWFGISSANEQYRGVADQSPTLVALDGDRAIGFVTVVVSGRSDRHVLFLLLPWRRRVTAGPGDPWANLRT
jgi:hypothetical protein